MAGVRTMKPYYDSGGITIYHGDAREVLPTLPMVDLVLTDPPYGMSFRSNYH
jgi:site-specific DNA-methyltransferase (adenine-specific)